jgi:hypothetical protein
MNVRQFVRDARHSFAEAQLVLSTKLGKNQVGSMEEYRHITGVIVGYEKAGEILIALLKAGDADADDMAPGTEL